MTEGATAGLRNCRQGPIVAVINVVQASLTARIWYGISGGGDQDSAAWLLPHQGLTVPPPIVVATPRKIFSTVQPHLAQRNRNTALQH